VGRLLAPPNRALLLVLVLSVFIARVNVVTKHLAYQYRARLHLARTLHKMLFGANQNARKRSGRVK